MEHLRLSWISRIADRCDVLCCRGGTHRQRRWRVNVSWCLQEGRKAAGWSKRKEAWEPISEENTAKVGNLFLRTRGRLFAFPLNPLRLNERLAMQRGVFLCSGDVTQSMAANLGALPGSEKPMNVLKVILPKDISGDMLRRLYRVGVWRATLFPGLDAFACGIRTSMLMSYAASDWVVWPRERRKSRRSKGQDATVAFP